MAERFPGCFSGYNLKVGGCVQGLLLAVGKAAIGCVQGLLLACLLGGWMVPGWHGRVGQWVVRCRTGVRAGGWTDWLGG